jgi:mono/diheme cytochrome c family protein
MLLSLSTTNKIWIAGVGAAFIVFSLVCAMVIPRTRPDFPGKNLRLFIAISTAFFLAMMAAILIFAKEEEHAEAAEEPAGKIQPASGDPAAGKVVFTANSCGACHTFAPAATTSAVGPDLDTLAEAAAAAGEDLDVYTREAIVDPNAVIATGFTAGILPARFGTDLSEAELNDLVAFLTQS